MKRYRKIVVAGLARNVANEIVRTYEALSIAFSMFDDVSWLIVESDSSDGTVEELKKLENKYSNLKYYSLGNLETVIKSRTERIAYCRNMYLEKIFNSVEYSDCDYVAVADLDSVNHEISYDGVLSCWESLNWDVCTANQNGPYYDLWALDCDGWNTGDCWEQYNFLRKYIKDDWALAISVVGKMIEISKDSEFINVNSAFGGLAIYRKSILTGTRYLGASFNGNSICEHISLHKMIKDKGGRIFINPKMTNSGVNEHTHNHLKFINQIKR